MDTPSKFPLSISLITYDSNYSRTTKEDFPALGLHPATSCYLFDTKHEYNHAWISRECTKVRVEFDVPRISTSRQTQSPINAHSPLVLPSCLKKENNSYETINLCARAYVCCLSYLEFTISTFEFGLFSGHLEYVPFDDSLTLQFLNSYKCRVLGFVFDYVSCTYSLVMDWLHNKRRQKDPTVSSNMTSEGQVVKWERHWALGTALVRGNISSKSTHLLSLQFNLCRT